MITQQQIQEIVDKYKDKKGFRENPVRNFLGSMQDNKMHNNMNLAQDARSYAWKPCIVSAIREGIRIA